MIPCNEQQPEYTSSNKIVTELIEKIRHRFTNMMRNLKGKSYDERLKSLGLLTLEERRNGQDLIELFTILK